jgi:hypothetical protein
MAAEQLRRRFTQRRRRLSGGRALWLLRHGHGVLAPAHRPRGRQPGDTQLSGILEVLLSMAAELQTNELITIKIITVQNTSQIVTMQVLDS